MRIRIKNLRLRTHIGFKEHEIGKQQDVVINIEIDADLDEAASSDAPERTLDYKVITKQVIALVEESEHDLLEALVDKVADIAFEDKRVRMARVEIDKPHALRFADSVSVETTRRR